MISTGVIVGNKVQLVCDSCLTELGWDYGGKTNIEEWVCCPYCGEPLYPDKQEEK